MTPWEYFTTTVSNTCGTTIAGGYNAYIGEGVFFAVQNLDSVAISGPGSDTEVRVEGTVAGFTCIALGSDATTITGEIVTVSTSGKVFADDTAIEIVAKNSTVHNDGSIIAENIGITLGGTASGTLSEVDNTGSVDGGSYGIKIGSGSEGIEVINSGTIKGIVSSYETAGNATDQIYNSGTMTGEILLGDGDDLYSGAKGNVQGSVNGGAGLDRMIGGSENNEFYGQAGEDILTGNKGADLLSGGTEADTFVYRLLSDSTFNAKGRDTIVDFHHSEGDRINIHLIDADVDSKGNQDFDLIGKTAFSHTAGELRFETVSGHTALFGDVNGDGKSDFAIEFGSVVHFKDADFVF
jgi:Ca2+-binding RTX toxin-like protein